MRLRAASPADIEPLQALRLALWTDCTIEDLTGANGARVFGSDYLVLLAEEDADTAIAFAEVALRRDYVNGCDGTPVAFLEGIYVTPDHRRTGIARTLVRAAADWGRARGAVEFASDALLDNHASHAFHKAVGFEETERVVYFRLADETVQ
jgi:aminoglycoside 6'-N-acetyltransferase I